MNQLPGTFTPEAVHIRLRNRNWQLVGPYDPAAWERFLDTVATLLREAEASPQPPATRLDRAVTGAYCTVLHQACADNGTRRQSRAYTEVWNWVYPIVVKQTNTLDDAEDIAQEVLQAVFQSLRQVDRPSGFLAWVAGIAFRRLRRYYAQLAVERRYFTYDGLPDEDRDEPNPLIPTTHADLVAARSELADAIAEMLAILEECLPQQAHRQRLVFVAVIFRQRSVEEIAQEYGMTAAAVHTAWSRIRQALQDGCSGIIALLIRYLELVNVSPTGDVL